MSATNKIDMARIGYYLACMMMKTLIVLASILGLVNQSSAQIGYGSASAERPSMICDLSQAVKASVETTKVIGENGSTYRCRFKDHAFETSFVGVDFRLAIAKRAGSKLALTVQCSTGSPTGIYYFGGYPVGFQTSTFKNIPWFYNPNPKAPGGRCHLMGDDVLIKLMNAVVNKSVMVTLPLKASLN